MRAPFIIFIAATVALTGCASIPLSTALRFSAMSPRDFAQIDPEQVQVRVSLPIGFTLDVPKTRLSLRLRGTRGDRAAELTLMTISVAQTIRPGGLLGADTAVTTHILRLAPEGVGRLIEVQQFILTSDPKKFNLGIEVPFAKVPQGTKEIVFWADLKLSNQDPFQPLAEGVRIEFKAAKDGS